MTVRSVWVVESRWFGKPSEWLPFEPFTTPEKAEESSRQLNSIVGRRNEYRVAEYTKKRVRRA